MGDKSPKKRELKKKKADKKTAPAAAVLPANQPATKINNK